jgi:hypothetical protein
MRKVIWCCSAAGVLAAGSFLSLAYYACCCPDSVVGRSMQVIAEASIAMQPLSGLTSMAVRTNQAHATADETATPLDECVPDDPQPIAAAPAKEPVGIIEQVSPVKEREFEEAAPIVIHEDDPMPREEAAPVAPAPLAGEAEFKDIEITVNGPNFTMADFQGQEIPPKGHPTVMPPCRDDDEGPVTPPKKMPRADAGAEMEHSVFKAWMELFAEGNKEKAPEVEELPAPQEEEAQEEPKCEEDRHLHENYPGCPRTTCPYTDRNYIENYYKRPWNLDPNFDPKVKKKGGEESSEEPPHSGKDYKDKEECPRTKGVDTMEYRKSDAGLDEYGPGQVH